MTRSKLVEPTVVLSEKCMAPIRVHHEIPTVPLFIEGARNRIADAVQECFEAGRIFVGT
jgi:hypothetical protein